MEGGEKGFLQHSRGGGVVLEALLHQHRNGLEEEVVVPWAGGVLAHAFQVAVELAQHHLKNAVLHTIGGGGWGRLELEAGTYIFHFF